MANGKPEDQLIRKKCMKCGGSGKIKNPDQQASEESIPCPKCKGKGTIVFRLGGMPS